MFTELIDQLRCPNAHEDSWLVATSTRTGSRHILDGKLGCPVCKATFDIVDGEALFTVAPVLRSTITLDDDAAMRLAAQLHLVEAPQPVMLTGQWSRAVAPLRRIVPTVTIFVGDATSVIALDAQVSLLRLPASRIPLATGTLRGLALDRAHAIEWPPAHPRRHRARRRALAHPRRRRRSHRRRTPPYRLSPRSPPPRAGHSAFHAVSARSRRKTATATA